METKFANPQYYRHVDGGLYRAYTEVLHTEDMGQHMAYEHVWPFPVIACVRPMKAFVARFMPISEGEALALMASDRLAAQEAIRTSKKARQSLEGKVSKRSNLHLRTGQSAEDELYRLANAAIAEDFACRVTLYETSGDDHGSYPATLSQLVSLSPKELEEYDLIVLNATLGGLQKPWTYTYDPANMAGALVYL